MRRKRIVRGTWKRCIVLRILCRKWHRVIGTWQVRIVGVRWLNITWIWVLLPIHPVYWVEDAVCGRSQGVLIDFLNLSIVRFF